MVDRQHIERVLRLNGVTVDTSPEELQSVLKKAGLTDEDISNFTKNKAPLPQAQDRKPVEELPKKNISSVLKTDSALKPEHVRALLGIDMHISSMYTQNVSVYKNQGVSFLQIFTIIVLSLVFGGGALIGFMWHLEIGMFHVASMR